MAGDKDAWKEVEAVLDKARLSIDDVTARTLEYKQNIITSIDLETIKPVIHPKSLEGDAKLAAVLVDSAGELT